jgi:tRNA pseudouridine13 synthase
MLPELPPDELPQFSGRPLGSAIFGANPEDFRVDELLGFAPSGEGEHCLLWVEKCQLSSNEAAGLIADQLGIRKRLVSHCGLKDRNAITRQWFSVHLPGQDSPAAKHWNIEGLRVLEVTRNTRKLRRGVHAGNRFRIRLRECSFNGQATAERWRSICEHGVANYFGRQRFGRDGNNVDKARALFRGEMKVNDRLLRGLFTSAARSEIFNAVVAARVASGTWATPLEGEVYGFADNHSIILPAKQRGDESDRFSAHELELTAPLWGAGDLLSAGAVLELERGIVARYADLCEGLAEFGLRQQRRVMRLRPMQTSASWQGRDLILGFDLPKGTYATTVLSALCTLTSAPEG